MYTTFMATKSTPLWHVALLSGVTSAVVTGVVLFATLGTFTATSVSQENSVSSQEALPNSVELTSLDSPVTRVVERTEPAVVSVIITKDIPIIEQSFETIPGNPFFDIQIPRYIQRGSENREIGGGTAFFVRSDGLLMTNKHVVSDEQAQYTVYLNDGRKLPATVVARDTATDIALLKVEGTNFPFLQLSSRPEPVLGQTVVAIGNALAEFRNTVSVGVISGLRRSIVAGGLGNGQVEQLNSIIQTDAAINQGNSGGPLLDLQGNVLGMNTAVANTAQNIAFAIPSSDLNRVLQSYTRYGRIVRPYLGVRYAPVTADVQKEKNLAHDYGAIVVKGDAENEPAVLPGSPAEKAGLKEGDVILEADGIKITLEQSLASIIQRKLPGDTLRLRVVSGGTEKTLTVNVEELKEQ